MVALERFGNLFAEPTLCVVGILGEKTLFGHHFGTHWCHVFLEPQRGSPSSSQYFSSPVPRHHFCVPPTLEDPPECPDPTLRVRLVVEITQSVFRPLDSVDEKARHQTYITKWKWRVPANSPFVFPMVPSMATNLHHDRSIQISLVIVQPLDSNSLPTFWCLGTRTYTMNFRNFSRSLPRPSCTMNGCNNSPLRCP